MSVSYYDQQAASFAHDTLSVDMTLLYDEFLPLLAPGSVIVDAGCGAGRDSRFFLSKGFQVLAFDASKALVDIAEQVTGIAVAHSTFLRFTPPINVDAIWACASLLHVPKVEQQATFQHLAQWLKPEGILYCSYKYGDNDYAKAGRQFTNANETRLAAFLEGAGLRIKKVWITADARPGRTNEQWLNAILEKIA